MQKIFILGASNLQVPAIKKAKEKGLYVYVLDYNPNAEGIKYADEFLCISTIDKEAVLEASKKYSPDYIITSTSDMPVQTVAWVNEQLGKKNEISYNDSICATNKGAMRQRMKKCGVPVPEFYIIRSFGEFESYFPYMPEQFIIKPVDNAASRGVKLIDKRNMDATIRNIYDYTRQFSRTGEILLEEYIIGPEVSVESFTVDKVTHVITITDKIVTEQPYFVELGHTEPSRFPLDIQEEIKKAALAAVKALNLNNGPAHTEIKVTKDGVKLVEIAARLGGDFITSKLVPLSTGIDMIECSIASILGEKIEYKKKQNRGAAIRYIPFGKGIYKGVNNIDIVRRLKGVIEVEVYKKAGDYISGLTNSSDRLGHVIAIGRNADEAAFNCDRAIGMLDVDFDYI